MRSFPSQREEAADNGADSTMPTFGTEIERPSDVALKVEIARDRLQFLHKPSLADARLPAHDDDRPRGPLSDRSQRPATLRELAPAADDWQAAGGGLPQPLEAKDRDGALEALQIVSAEGFVVREPGGHTPDFLRHERLVGSRLTEQPGGEIGRLTHDGIFAPPLAADPARHNLAHGEPDMDGERARGRSELRGDGRLDLERRAHGAQAIVAVRARSAEQRHRGVADMLVDRAAVAVDDGVDDCEKPFENRVDFLGVEPGRQPHIADEIAEHNRDRAAFGGDLRGLLRGRRRGHRVGSLERCQRIQSGDRVEKLAPVADDRDAEILQIFGRQARQEVAVDRVIAERRFVLPETEILEPGRDVHGRLQSAGWDNHTRPAVCKASTSSGRGLTAGQCPSMAQPTPSAEDRFLDGSARSSDRPCRAAKGRI